DPAKRSFEQRRRLRNILGVTGIAEQKLLAHMNWSTFMFLDLVQKRLDGLNPFDNSNKIYRGSDDDVALNAGIERFTADPRAVAKLAYDADLSGMIVLPTLTMHALHDPTVFTDLQADYARVVAATDRSHLLTQIATDEYGHSKLAETQYIALLTVLNEWIDTGHRPSAEHIAATCLRLEAAVPGGCHFITGQRLLPAVTQ